MTSSPPPRDRSAILPILAVNFVGTLGYSIVLPFLVFLVTRLGGNALVYGVVGATYSAFQLVGAPVLGRWSDRVGRKRVLLISQLGTFLSWGIFLLALALPVHPLVSVDSGWSGGFTVTLPLLVLFLARALDGLTGGNVSVANAYVADISSEADRGSNFGRLAVSSNLGFVLGPALAGLLGAVGAGTWGPVFGAWVISGAAAVLVKVTLANPEPCVLTLKPGSHSVGDVLGGDRKECYRLRGGKRLPILRLLSLPRVGLLLGLQGLVYLAFNVYYVAFPAYASGPLAWSLGQVGVYFTVMGLLMALIEGPVLGRLSKWVRDPVLVIGGSLSLAAGFALHASSRAAVIYGGIALLALGNGLMWPSLLSLLSRAAGQHHQGGVQGLSGSVTALASIVGLVAGGGLFQILGPRVFLLSAGVTVGVAIAALGKTGGGDRGAPDSDPPTRSGP